MYMDIPAPLTASSFSRVDLSLPKAIDDSVISSPKACGGSPEFFTREANFSAKSICNSCIAETLNSMQTSIFDNVRANSMQLSSTQSPSVLIKPFFSAMGIKTSGGTAPKRGLFQRASASTAPMRSVVASYIGW